MPILKAFIVPHPPVAVPLVGRGQQKIIQKTVDAFDAVGREIEQSKPDTIIVISPHSVRYRDYIHISSGAGARGDLKSFNAPGIFYDKKYDSELVEAIAAKAESAGISAGTLGEKDTSLDHGVIVPLYFIERHFKDYNLVRISVSGLPGLEHYNLGKCISSAVESLGRKVVIVASGDLSHKLTETGPYGFAPEGPEFDKQVTEAMKKSDFLSFLTFDEEFTDAAGECGLRSFIIMAGALDGKSLKTDFYSYEGPFGVGYAVCSYAVTGEDSGRRFDLLYGAAKKEILGKIKESEDEYVRLARLSLESFIKSGRQISRPDGLSEELLENRAGVFVSLKKDGMLRGCIGTIEPTLSNIAEEIISNAVSSGMDDPRFGSVTEDELDFLIYSVDVLGKPEPVASINELDAKRYGVIVSDGHRRGVLLPNLEGIDNPRQQLEIALQKAGIPQGSSYSVSRFEVVRHK